MDQDPQHCLDSIKAMGDVYGGYAWCHANQPVADKHCSNHQKQRGDPFPLPRLLPGGGYEWIDCCCSCFGYDTPIAIPDASQAGGIGWELVQNIKGGKEGSMVLAAGLDLKWKQAKVVDAGGPAGRDALISVLHVIFRYDADLRFLEVSPDHPFLLTSGKLKFVQFLAPGDKLRRADGGEAEVVQVWHATTRGMRSIDMGLFDGENLDGHLLNAYGVVTADFSVQSFLIATDLPTFTRANLLDPSVFDKSTPVAGSEEYHTKYPSSQEAMDFAKSQKKLHSLSIPSRPPQMVNIPPNARTFITPEQANDIKNNAELLPSTVISRLSGWDYIVGIARIFYPNIIFLADWDNNLPNAYTWSAYSQPFVVVTGGLLRVLSLRLEGLSLVLSHLLAYYDAEPAHCVGEADFNCVNSALRQIWQNVIFEKVALVAVGQVKELFGNVLEKNAEEDPNDRCSRPSLECRNQAFMEGLLLHPLPTCAGVTNG